MSNIIQKLYNIFFSHKTVNNIWQKQLFRKYLLNTKNIFFNEFIIENLLPKNWLLLQQNKNNNNSDIKLDNLSLINVDLWSNYIMLWRYEEQQRLLDNAFIQSRYFKNLENNTNFKTQILKKKNLYSDLSLWYQLGYSLDYLNTLNSTIDFKNYLIQNRSTILLEDSIEYQHKLNIHLIGILDNLSSLYEKDVFLQSKTIRGIFFRFFREILYPWFSSIILTFMSFFIILLELLYLLSSLIAIPILCFLFVYIILTDSISNFDLETVWLQFNFFEFIMQYLVFYFPNFSLLLDYDISIYFNNFCWVCLYLFFFFMLLFEGAGWMGILATEEDNMAQYLYTDEGTMYEDIHDSCNLSVLELMLELSDHDFTNTDYNNYYIFSENSDEFRNIEAGFSDLNQFAVQIFTAGIGILYMMQTVIQQDDIEDNELHDLYYYDGMPRHNQEYDDDPEFDFGSSVSYLRESDSSFGLYEYPLDSINVQITQYGSKYNIFDEEGANIEAFVAMPSYGFDIFSDSSLNYFLEFMFGNSLFDIFLFFIIFFYSLLYFKIYYDWEIWIYREYTAREYFNRITYLGWQHSLTNEEVISDEDIINNTIIIEPSVLTVSGYEQLSFVRDYNPLITDIEYFFEDLNELIDFKNEYFREDDVEFVEQDEFSAIDDILEDDEIVLEDFNEEKNNLIQEDVLVNYNLMNFENNQIDFQKSLNQTLFFNFKNFYLLMLNFRKNLNLNFFFQNIFEFSNLFIYLYKNLSKISNSFLKYSILQLLYFYINIKKIILSYLLYDIQKLSNLQILFLKMKLKSIQNKNILFEINNEIYDLLITPQIQENLTDTFETVFENDFFDLDDEDFFDVLSENTYIDDISYYKNFLTNFYILLKKDKKKNFLSSDIFSYVSLYPQFFQQTIIGSNNIFILDEENDLQIFSLDFEDNIDYFNVDTMDVDFTNNNLEDEDDLFFYNDETEQDDYSANTVYIDDDNPYDIFSYDLFFYKVNNFKLNDSKNNNINFIFLKSNFSDYFNLNQQNNYYLYKNYNQDFNNFFLYSWSELFLENSFKETESLYNITSINEIEFDTNYIEFMDDELYDDEKFLVPTQRLLLHSLINNFRYETNSWLDGWGTWSFLNTNKFEGTLNTVFHYDIFHADDDFDTDEEDMIEMNMTFFSDTLADMYNDNVLDENSEYLDGLPDFSSIFDDLDGYEEDFLETSYLVEKPYVFVILLILFFECLTIFFIEYYFMLYVFFEPENGDNFFSDLVDYRYTGIFFDILKLKSYNIYLFIYNYLTFHNNLFNEINAYQLVYYSVFCFLDESSGLIAVRDGFLQQVYQQSFMFYFVSLYETYSSKLLHYLFIDEIPIDDEDLGIISDSQAYYNEYASEQKKYNYVQMVKNFILYIIYSIYESFVAFYYSILYFFQKIICFFYYVKFIVFFFKLFFLESYIYLNFLIILIPKLIIYIFFFLYNYLIIEELYILFQNFNFFFFYFISYIFIFFWRFYFDVFFHFDYFIYLIINFFFLKFFDSLDVQILALYDFSIYYKFGLKYLYFFKLNNYIQTFQYFNDISIKNITIINKYFEKGLNNLSLLTIQFIIAEEKLYIIINNFFAYFTFLKINIIFENNIYLVSKILELNIYNYFQIFYLLEYIFISIIYYFFYFCIIIGQIYKYDLYLAYIILNIYYFFFLFQNIYVKNDYNLVTYTINRYQQFDDKLYYNRETINLKPEILYDIETLTFFNNTIDSYIYWL